MCFLISRPKKQMSTPHSIDFPSFTKSVYINMATPLTLDISGQNIQITATPLDRRAFAPFGDVIANPRPELHPSAFTAPSSKTHHPADFDAVSANQGTAIKYQNVSRLENLYGHAPGGRAGSPAASMFVCAARVLGPGGTFPVRILERHPFTTQTFTPLARGGRPGRYLVIVAPSLPPGSADAALPVPPVDATGSQDPREGLLPGRGLPDVRNLRAFVATTAQAVTYGAGTWHAPMVALGEPGTAVDFVVMQFVSGVGIEDCQEVVLSTGDVSGSDSAGAASQVVVRVPEVAEISRL